MAREWPLVAFTIVGQLAVGIYLFGGGCLFLSRLDNGPGGRVTRLTVVIAVLGLLAGAALLSFFHLHHPLRAVRSLSNFRTSWLSREILSELALMILLTILGLCLWRGVGSPRLILGIFTVGGIAGTLFVLSMAKIYTLAAVPAWNHAYTPFSFFLTPTVLGTTASSLVLSGSLLPGPGRRVLWTAGLISAAAALLCAAIFSPGHGILGGRAEPSLRPPVSAPFLLHVARLGCLFSGLVILAAAVLSRSGSPGIGNTGTILMTAVFVLLSIGEVIGRFLFYGQLSQLGSDHSR